MREDLRPFWVKRTYLAFRAAWIDWFVRPRCAHLGTHATIMAPWYVDISGPNIRIGHSFTAINTASQRVQIGVWGREAGQGRITLGDACLMSPGSRISASDDIVLGDGCMLANGAYITDSDWHGLYDRVERAAEPTPVRLGDNVWVGDHATVLKGVTIGDNSVVAARAVVTSDVPADVVVAGNPAKVVKTLDPDTPRYTRADLYADPDKTAQQFKELDRYVLGKNRLWFWVWTVIYPGARREG
jgi:acetyltransferase-like isoleucine patch superfamily enzyme